MRSKTMCSWLLRLCLLFLLQTSALAIQQEQRVYERHNAPFRYVICGNTISPVGERKIIVLLDPVAFSEDNLKKVYFFVAKRFPEPADLSVWVYTSLWQVETPEEAEIPHISDIGDDPHNNQFQYALLMRVRGNELFRYSSDEKPPYRRLKTVIITGRDPFDANKK